MSEFEDFEDEEDFELEFSDLPPDEQRSVSGQLVEHGSRLFSGVRHLTELVVERGTRLLATSRTRLLQDVTNSKLPDAPAQEDFELEFTDLPTVEEPTIPEKLVTWGPRLHSKVRVRRLAMTASTACMLLFLVLTSIPSSRNWLYTLVVPSTPTPVVIGSNTTSSSDILPQKSFIIQGNTWQLVPGATNGDAPPYITSITPGPPPPPQLCSAPPVQGTSSVLGTAPVWATGFSGPYATLYLSDAIPVPTSPSLYGFPVPIQIEAPANYKGEITLSGMELSNDMDVTFGFSPFNEQVSHLILNTQSQDGRPYTILVDGKERIAWNITMFLPAADCYTLKAAWPGGHWVTIFAAGA